MCLRTIYTAGFYNPDGKSCGITASLSLMQYIKPFMELVASRNWQEPSRGKNVFYVYFLSLTQRTLFSGLNKICFCQKASLIRGVEGPIRFVAAKC